MESTSRIGIFKNNIRNTGKELFVQRVLLSSEILERWWCIAAMRERTGRGECGRQGDMLRYR
tara:strand:- start:178 stop:363 length:186 start_codon:yes stop_codon:yes gene_type:complete